LSGEAVIEYLNAYKTEVEFNSAPRKLLELAVQHPSALKGIVQSLWLAHPEQSAMGRLHHSLDGVAESAQAQLKVLRFLQTGGN